MKKVYYVFVVLICFAAGFFGRRLLFPKKEPMIIPAPLPTLDDKMDRLKKQFDSSSDEFNKSMERIQARIKEMNADTAKNH
jgi:hypothetical protein